MKNDQIIHTESSETISSQNGFCEVHIKSVKNYAKFAVDNFHGKSNFFYRGQENSQWKLESSFQRLENSSRMDLDRHLKNFKAATRGRRGTNPRKLTDDGWWALGQHYGLGTPLLDWSRSYWVALYFAFYKATQADFRAVYAIDFRALPKQSPLEEWDGVEIVDPDVHANPRLLSQSGIFLKLSIEENLEEWVQNKFSGHDQAVLIKMKLPNQDQNYCIRDVNRMNINHMTLFPDLAGACGFANTALRLPDIGIAEFY